MDPLSFYYKTAIKTSQWFGLQSYPTDWIIGEEEPSELATALPSEKQEKLPEEKSSHKKGPKTSPEPSAPPLETPPPEVIEERAEDSSLSPEEKLRALIKRASQCSLCRLSETRQKVVMGSGKVGSAIMIVGEGPGAEEDRQGLPFVGKAGQLLTKMLKAIEVHREDVYITNVVKCRPPQNRDPQGDEILSCRPYLLEQIDLVGPRILLALGGYASRTLLEKPTASLKSLRGKVWKFHHIPLVVTYHPAALLRNPQYKRPAWEDLQFLQKIFQDIS